MPKIFLSILTFLLLIGCGEAMGDGSQARIFIMGDSMLASNRGGNQAVGNVLETELGQEVIDRSVSAARYFYFLPISGAAGLSIPAQYRAGNWDWVVMNGGGNDLLFGCGCGLCQGTLDRLVSADGRSGAIPQQVAAIRQSGARVIYLGYLRNPGTFTPIKGCRAAGDELDRRIATMSTFDAGVTFVSLADLVPHGDWSYHQLDRIHPSVKGSAAIAKRVAAVIRAAPRRRPQP
ncbi:SGNH/GDSL hydrolase family protein [Pseudotabrizicola sp. L79]|uniref:SGNH/GDSL hydrolase family protein n=1 Tax=Pseudotabrizicola sp. L79 TaxID=3118402 RepID=UPI002F91E54F